MALTLTVSNSTGTIAIVAGGDTEQELRSLSKRAQLYVTLKHRDHPEFDPWEAVITGSYDDCPVCGTGRTVNSTYKRG